MTKDHWKHQTKGFRDAHNYGVFSNLFKNNKLENDFVRKALQKWTFARASTDKKNCKVQKATHSREVFLSNGHN